MKGPLIMLVLLGLLGGPAWAQDGEPLLDAVPPEISALSMNEREQQTARVALSVVQRAGTVLTGRSVDSARAWLLLLEGAGLRAVAEELARGKVTTPSLPHLLQVIAESPLPEADLLLARGARSPRYALRLIAADGLGRGRTASATAILGELAYDEVPGVRLAALRSLFAIESPQAATLRQDLAFDAVPSINEARLRWHRRVSEYPLPILEAAAEMYRSDPSSPLGLEAAAYLAHAGSRAPAVALEEVLAGATEIDAVGQPRRRPSQSALYRRQTAVGAVLGLLDHPDVAPARKASLLDMAVEMVARPIAMDPMGRDPIPEDRLRQRLPDIGAALIAPVLAQLTAGAFAEPRAGVILLRELGPALALPALRSLLEAALPGGACAASPHAPWLRSAAAGALRDLGRVEDEALARRLLQGDDSAGVKIDVLLALAQDMSLWVLPVLEEQLKAPDRSLRSHALDVLERRPEPRAREVLIQDLFERAELPHDRLATLVAPGDAPALELLARALNDTRPLMRVAAIYQFRRHATLRSKEARALLDKHASTATAPLEIQEFIYVLLLLDPPAAVKYVRQRWATFPTESVRLTALRQLQEVTGPASRSAIDFVLALLAAEPGSRLDREASTVLAGRWGHRDEEIAAFWRRLLTGESDHLRIVAVRGLRHPKAFDFTDLLLPLLFKALSQSALGEEASGSDEFAHAQDLVATLALQEWAKVEPSFLRLVMTPEMDLNVRTVAAQEMIGRLSPSARETLMRWLRYTPTTDGDSGGPESGIALQTLLAAAIGEGADASVAAAMLDVLKREVVSLMDEEGQLLLERGQEAVVRRQAPRVMALARGIAHSRDPATIQSLVAMLFDLRLALLAQGVEQRAMADSPQPTADAAGRIPARLLRRAQLDERGNALYFGMPAGVFEMFSPLRVLDDATLAAAFERTLDETVMQAGLGNFPDLYLMRIALALRHEATGAMPQTAAVVGKYMRNLSPIEGPYDYQVLRREVDIAALNGRLGEAVRGQEALVRIVARQGADDREPGTWVHERAALDALRAAWAKAQGSEPEALAHLQRGLQRAGSDVGALNVVAWYAALGGVGLDLAEEAARRAVRLETRLGEPASSYVADTLAYVLLRSGKPAQALAALAPRLPDRFSARDGQGLVLWHLAQIHLALGHADDAQAACIDALVWDRSLRPLMEADPYLSALCSNAALWQSVLHAARLERKNRGLE